MTVVFHTPLKVVFHTGAGPDLLDRLAKVPVLDIVACPEDDDACLMRLLPDGPLLDAGCGSGTLALAWARLGRGPVLAVDLDPRSVTHTLEAVVASGLSDASVCRRAALDQLDRLAITGRVVLANAPRQAQDALLAVPGDPAPPALLLSGLNAADMDDVAEQWTARGMRVTARDATGRWQAAILVAS